ncbi:M35 family metallopeptidase [Nocardia rhizosphaerihabitans]|uniref:Lysine-specific metallo-endopeptidase domain-containing protein n=1 Tax=Nocardia rhizosphaerihabitans TaxID=1691570 RepID=A0ABQ2K2G1_9NOCA|nr:M35 family metallopeptidase [Nocardia rhizosphaerihabitans]GGN65976.1 hypothetical protein GCM10011610_00410 [Nocardia rhizosphaerihabitans]
MIDNQPFECSLQGRTSYRLGEPIVLTFAIRNAANHTYALLTWNTPLAGDPLNFLVLTRDGITVRYDGRHVQRGNPADSDYLALAPGQSRTADIDIARLYRIEEPGHYRATLATVLSDARAVDPGTERPARSLAEHAQHPLPAASVEFTVTPGDAPALTFGQQARTAEQQRAAEPGVRIFGPDFVGGTGVERGDVLTAHNAMIARAAAAVQQLTTTSVAVNQRYAQWFGTDGNLFGVLGPTRYQVITSHFTTYSTLPSAMFPITPTYDLTRQGCAPSYVAYTYDDSGTVWLCNQFFGRPLSGFDSKIGTLIHEWSHSRHYTEDYANGQTACKNLAANDPARAVFNGDNHGFFAESL